MYISLSHIAFWDLWEDYISHGMFLSRVNRLLASLIYCSFEINVEFRQNRGFICFTHQSCFLFSFSISLTQLLFSYTHIFNRLVFISLLHFDIFISFDRFSLTISSFLHHVFVFTLSSCSSCLHAFHVFFREVPFLHMFSTVFADRPASSTAFLSSSL